MREMVLMSYRNFRLLNKMTDIKLSAPVTQLDEFITVRDTYVQLPNFQHDAECRTVEYVADVTHYEP